jgi:hypothetical protein
MRKRNDKNVKVQRLRDYLVGMKRVDSYTKYCPLHPDAPCTWDSGNGYYRLLCSECNGHNMFTFLGNFNLYLLPRDLETELAYVQRQYNQLDRGSAPITYLIPKVNLSLPLLARNSKVFQTYFPLELFLPWAC